jgi:bacillithiol system protein YtxJ
MMLNWNVLTDIEQLDTIKEKSFKKPQVLFKHSKRCGLSNVALKRIKKAANISAADFHFLDLISFRKVSDKIADEFGVCHQSPQILLIKDGTCIYNESHLGIDLNELKEQIFSAN